MKSNLNYLKPKSSTTSKCTTLLSRSVFLICILSLSIGTSFAQLKQANKAKKRGAFLLASFYTLQSLTEQPIKNKRAQKLLSECFPLAMSTTTAKINRLMEESEDFYGDETVRQRSMIVNKLDSLKLLQKRYKNLAPQALESKKLKLSFDVSKNYQPAIAAANEKLVSAKEEAAQMHYDSGMDLLEEVGLQNCRTAAREFRRAQGFVADFKDSNTKYQEARACGTKRIAIIPFSDKSYSDRFGDIGERISDNVLQISRANPEIMEFVEFVDQADIAKEYHVNSWDLNEIISPSDATQLGKKLRIDEIWMGQITQAIAEPEIHSAANETVTSSVVVGTEKYTKKNGKTGTRNIYGDVNAYVKLNQKNSSGILNWSFKILEVSNSSATPFETGTEKVHYNSSWYTYISGDKRAFTGLDRTEESLPSSGERIDVMMNSAAAKIAAKLKVRELKVHIPIVIVKAE